MKLFSCCALALAFSALASRGEAPTTIRTDVEIIAISSANALRLLPELRRPESFVAGETRLQALLADGDAELLGWPIVEGTSAAATTSRSSVDIRFATEYMPPQLPHIFGGNNYPLIEHNPLTGDFATYPPTAFDTRETGVTLSVTPTQDVASGSLRMAVDFKFTRLEGSPFVIGAPYETLGSHRLQQPLFSNRALRSAITLRNDGRMLLTSFSRLDPRFPSVVLLIHAVAVPAVSSP